MSIILLGMSHQTTPVELREQFYIRDEALKGHLLALRAHSPLIDECAIISTCNRLELYCVGDEAASLQAAMMAYLCEHYEIPADELQPYCYILTEEDAIRHLLRVSSGLESLVLGEDQILGQVTRAGEAAMASKTSRATLNRLFSHASYTGKRARTHTAINQNTTSVSHAAGHLIAQHYGQVEGIQVLILGAGEMAELALQAMQMQGFDQFIVANRTYERALELAQRYQVEAIRWLQIFEQLSQVDVVLAATGAPHTVLQAEDVQAILAQNQRETDLLMVDISVPRNIDAQIDHLDRVQVFDIDSLQRVLDGNMAQRRACIPDVEAIIETELANFQRWLREHDVVPTISDLRGQVHAMAAAELEMALAQLSHLSERDQGIIKKLVHRVVNKVLHHPTVSLRRHASMPDAEVFTQVIQEAFALSVAAHLEAPSTAHWLPRQNVHNETDHLEGHTNGSQAHHERETLDVRL